MKLEPTSRVKAACKLCNRDSTYQYTYMPILRDADTKHRFKGWRSMDEMLNDYAGRFLSNLYTFDLVSAGSYSLEEVAYVKAGLLNIHKRHKENSQ